MRRRHIVSFARALVRHASTKDGSKSQGKWDTSVGGKKFTLLDGYGKPTEIGWRVIDNTGITEEDFLDQHQAGSQAVLPVNAVCNRIWWMFPGEQLLCCHKCIRWIDGWRDKHKQQQATWATFALDVSDLPAIRHRRRLGAGTVTSVLTCTCMKSVDLVGQVRLTFTNALGRPNEELIDDPQVCFLTPKTRIPCCHVYYYDSMSKYFTTSWSGARPFELGTRMILCTVLRPC